MEAIEVLQTVHFNAPYWEFALPCVAAAADIITGWIQASINGTWDSTKMRRGLYRKLGEILVVVLAWVVGIAVSLPFDVASAAAVYIVVMECISIMENMDQAGVNIPFLKKLLKKAKEAIDDTSTEEKKDA
jgi:toxin secretion/phage lysis holin